MKPDNVTSSGQGTGTPTDKSGNTERGGGSMRAPGEPEEVRGAGARGRSPADDRIRKDDERWTGPKGEGNRTADRFGDSSDDLDHGDTATPFRHPNRPERQKARGNFNGPDKGRGR